MGLIQEIHAQHRGVRLALWALSVTTVLSVVGFFWITSIEREMFMALHTDVQERQQFLARQDARTPKPLALITKGVTMMTARISDLIGIDRQKGFHQESGSVYLLPTSQ